MIKISKYQTQIKCIRLTLTRKHREQNAYGYGSWRKHIKKIIDLWSISFKLVDFTLRNCTRVQPYVFTTLSGLFSHQSLKIWLSNKISSIHSSKSVIFVLPVPFQSGFLLVHVWFKYVIVWMKVAFNIVHEFFWQLIDWYELNEIILNIWNTIITIVFGW